MNPAASHALSEQRAAIRAWLLDLMARRKIKPVDIAAKVGVSGATIYRMLAENGPHTPNLGTITRIAQTFDEPMPGAVPPPAKGLAEGDVAALEGEAGPDELQPRTPDQSVMRIGNRALELAGFLPGDLVLMDMAGKPQAGDIVVAQVYDFETGGAMTRLRKYDGLYLTTATMDPLHVERPLMVDGERVVIVGRVVKLFRKLS